MFKNKMAPGVEAKGTPNIGGGKADANMPANNKGTFPVKLGAGQKSKFGQGVGMASAQKGADQKSGSKANMQANNVTDRTVKLGNTKHGVGNVPGYLKNSY
jgi:hypothetical protein